MSVVSVNIIGDSFVQFHEKSVIISLYNDIIERD